MADRPKTKRIFPGDFRGKSDPSHAYDAFFSAISKCAPEVLEALRASVYPVFVAKGNCFDALGKWMLDCNLLPNSWTPYRLGVFGLPEGADTSDERLISIIRHASALQGMGIGILSHWGKSSEARESLTLSKRRDLPPESEIAVMETQARLEDKDQVTWDKNKELVQPPIAYDYHFVSPRWSPRQEQRSEARRRILADLEKQLDEALEADEVLAKRAGWEPTPVRHQIEHYDWLVRYQVQGWDYMRIAKEHGTSRQVVTDGVKNAAEMLVGNLAAEWLRTPRRGRPSSATTSES